MIFSVKRFVELLIGVEVSDVTIRDVFVFVQMPAIVAT